MACVRYIDVELWCVFGILMLSCGVCVECIDAELWCVCVCHIHVPRLTLSFIYFMYS